MLKGLTLAVPFLLCAAAASAEGTLTGEAAFGDWHSDRPGVRRLITPADLPAANLTPENGAAALAPILPMPADAKPAVPPGFAVDLFAGDLKGPRVIRVAPNGDIFVAESGAGRITVLRTGADGKVSERSVFAENLGYAYGIAFYPAGNDPVWLYVAESNRIIRFPYKSGDLKAETRPRTVLGGIPAEGHNTRDILFSPDNRLMYLTVGSATNAADGLPQKSPDEIARLEAALGVGAAWSAEQGRASIFTFDPSGNEGRIIAGGIRNCSGIAIQPKTNALWCAANERDGIGANVPPDFITHIADGAFYGWPWYYIGDHEDPRHAGERPDLKGKVTVPDVLLAPHSAPLGLVFYDGAMFPEEYRGDAFATMHGSSNRGARTGYKVVRIPMKDGVATGEYEDFMTGFVLNDDAVDGRPVGVAVAKDGALLVSEDGNNTIWRVSVAK
ncbi:MAG: PQQ-dependent sugar dehydrogenase [Bauldia sp.]